MRPTYYLFPQPHYSKSVTNSPLKPINVPPFRDRFETKAAAWIQPWDGNTQADAIIVGAPLSKTSISLSGASQTPSAIREIFSAVSTYNIDHDIDLADSISVMDAGDARVHPTDLALCRSGIFDAVQAVCTGAPNAIPIILGGDHSITAPAVEAFKSHVSAKKDDVRIGLIQLDAHMDLRNLDDGGLTNGTPVRQLVESGTLKGEDIVQIGLHAFANAKPYRQFAVEQGITQFTARQVAHEGIEPLIEQAIEIASRNTDVIYVTLDMDVLDQAFAPGVPAQIPGGMTTWQLFDALLKLGQHPRVKALDVVEIDPTQDLRRATVRTAAHAILTFLTGYALR